MKQFARLLKVLLTKATVYSYSYVSVEIGLG